MKGKSLYPWGRGRKPPWIKTISGALLLREGQEHTKIPTKDTRQSLADLAGGAGSLRKHQIQDPDTQSLCKTKAGPESKRITPALPSRLGCTK